MHYSSYKDLIISYYSIGGDIELGKSYYDKYVKNINSAGVPVHSLYDFFWWNLFNIKYVSLSIGGIWKYSDETTFDYNKIKKYIINWFNTVDYQQWSMVNNNNGIP